jgi:Tfp pilus assembly protein PilZ
MLAEALIQDLDAGDLFVPGHPDLGAGQRIQVMVRIDGIEPGLLMAGTVLWRRVGRGPRALSGVGVRFEQTERMRFEWLRGLALSADEARLRFAPRYPVSIPVALIRQHETSVHTGTLVDVSEVGALLHAAAAPIQGQVVVLRLRDGRSGPPVPTRVIWTATEGAGLGILTDRPEVRRFWDRVVTAARQELEARLLRAAGSQP